MPDASPRRRWYEVDPIKVTVTVAILTVLMVMGGVLVYRNYVANLPEIGRVVPPEEREPEPEP